MEKGLNQIFKNQTDEKTILSDLKKEIEEVYEKIDIEKMEDGFMNNKENNTEWREAFCECPICGRNMYESERSYYCEGYKDEENPCHFTFWKDNAYFNAVGIDLSEEDIYMLLTTNKLLKRGIVSKRTGRPYDAIFSIDDYDNDTKRVSYKMSFPSKNQRK